MSQTDQQIFILGTGGTIAGQAMDASNSVNYTAALIDIKQLLAAAATTQSNDATSNLNGFELMSEQLVQVDSKDMSFDIWKRLLLRCQYLLSQPQVQAIVITHGTDTLEETAYFLHSILRPNKPVILTCAMRPANAHDSDGPQNLREALWLAAHPQAKGVLVACAGDIHSPQEFQKVHTTRLNAFSSGDAGLIGSFTNGKLNLSVNALNQQVQQKTLQFPFITINDIQNVEQLPRVEIIMNHADASGQIVDALVQHNMTQQMKLRGIVVAGTGNGTISMLLESALIRAQEAGIVVWRSTRCAFGKIRGQANAQFGDSYGLSPVKARVALMLQLMNSDLLAQKS